MTDRIDGFVATLDEEKRQIVSCLRNLASDIAQGAREDIKWNALCLFNEERAFVCFMPYKKYVSVYFDRGSELSDPDELLEGNGKQMRHVKIYRESDVEEKNIAQFIRQSHALK